MTDKKKITILLETNEQLQEEKKQLERENEELRLQLDDKTAANKLVKKYKKEQKKLLDDLWHLKKKYEQELMSIRKVRNDYRKMSKRYLNDTRVKSR